MPILSDEKMKTLHLTKADEADVRELLELGYLTSRDVGKFIATLEDEKPDAALVKKVGDALRTPSSKKVRAELLKIQIGGLQSRHKLVMEYYEPYVTDPTPLAAPEMFPGVPLLSLAASESSPPQVYDYVGRTFFAQLWAAVGLLRPGETLFLTGPAGSGKSYVFSTVGGLLHATPKYRVVFLIAGTLMENPLSVFSRALLLAFSDDILSQKHILELSTRELMIEWCEECGETLYFFVDEWNEIESEKSTSRGWTKERRDIARLLLLGLFSCGKHVIVKCASMRSDNFMEVTTKHMERTRLMTQGGPYSPTELECVVASLAPEALELSSHNFDYYTGGIPRLVTYYAKAYGVEQLKNEYFLTSETGITNYIKSLEPSDLVVFQKSLTGSLSAEEFRRSRMYTSLSAVAYVAEDGKGKMYCRYFQDIAFMELFKPMAHLSTRDLSMQLDVWRVAIHANIATGKYNPARVGWNAEALVVGKIELMGLTACLGLEFNATARYDTAGPHNVAQVPHSQHGRGILFIQHLSMSIVWIWCM